MSAFSVSSGQWCAPRMATSDRQSRQTVEVRGGASTGQNNSTFGFPGDDRAAK